MTFSQRRRSPSAVLALGAVVLLFAALALFLAACGGSSSTTLSSTATTGSTGSTASTGGTGGTVTTSGGGGGSVTTSAGAGSTIQVAMVNRTFDPANITIKVGDTVTWTNQDGIQHNVVADNGEFKSDLFGKGGTFSFTFTKAGTYPYYCSIHPGMVGTVTVQ